MSDNVAEETTPDATLDRDFEQLSQQREIGEPLTDEDWAAAHRVVNAYWPRFGTPRPLPDRWR
ncbi:hypothetical protein [Amycolatopsis plumensis]|uniref:Uncharacterized protein n=1 Tax=Amycolatopsis plumensis TaxID=236508 RepID=A0ABV5UCK8_9PSEU